MVHVGPGTGYRFAAGTGGLENVVSVGGPCPADLPFLRLCGAEIPEPPASAPGTPWRHRIP
jgi:hypothetical protein